MKMPRLFTIEAAAVLAIIAGIILAPMAAWYKAGVQVEVYRRQGVEMTTWEVFMGAKPVERYLKETP
jgi:hypothetical protein